MPSVPPRCRCPSAALCPRATLVITCSRASAARCTSAISVGTPQPSSPRSSATRTIPRSRTRPSRSVPSTPRSRPRSSWPRTPQGLRRGFRPRLASRRRFPDPKKIVEADSILNLLDNEFIVIACGGGGIPVVRDYENKGCYKGVPAVIDKDLGGELLAEDCDADVLFLLTAVEHVAINFGKPNQEELEDITADEAERLADEGQFGKGSMEPKVRAAIKFARSRKGRTCIIGALDKAAETMAGLSGTRIHE